MTVEMNGGSVEHVGAVEFDGISDDQLREVGRLVVGMAVSNRLSAYESAKAILAVLEIPFGLLSERQRLVMQAGADTAFDAVRDIAPDAGHAAETMSDEELIDRLIDAAVVFEQTREAIRWEHGAEAKDDLQLAFNRERKTLERRKADALRRMHAAETMSDEIAVSREDVTAALDSVNYHYILMAQSAAKWRRKRPADEETAQDCDRRCGELEALYRRIHERLNRTAPARTAGTERGETT